MQPPRVRNGPVVPLDVDVVSRREFLSDIWAHSPGQHVTMLGPTQRGKTTFCHQLLSQTISPDHRCVILSGKPPHRDHVMGKAATRLNLRITDEWPPTYSVRDRKRNGYVLRPKQTMRDIAGDNANLRAQFRRAMLDNYASRKPVITVADEAHHVQNDLKLKEEYEAALMRGAPVNSMWSLVQRGRFMSYHVYCEPEHLFIYHDPDGSNVKRYAEIGCVDPIYTADIVSNLRTYTVPTPTGEGTISECLYIRRSGSFMCIVDVN